MSKTGIFKLAPHMRTPAAKRAVMMAAVFIVEAGIALTIVCCATSTQAAGRGQSPSAPIATQLPTLRAAASLGEARLQAIAKLTFCETDTQCEAAEEQLNKLGCKLTPSGVTLCPVTAAQIEATKLEPMQAAPASQVAYYYTANGKLDCLADAEANGQVCLPGSDPKLLNLRSEAAN